LGANRASGEIAVIAGDAFLVSTIAVPDSGEPMYTNFSMLGTRCSSDRAHDAVVVFDATTHVVVDTIAVAGGVSHQWSEEHAGGPRRRRP